MMQSSTGTAFFIPALRAQRAVLCAGCGRTQWLCARVFVRQRLLGFTAGAQHTNTRTVECELQQLPLLNYL